MQPSKTSRDDERQLIKLLGFQSNPSAVINMFHEEKQKIVHRGIGCKSLLGETNSVLEELRTIKTMYEYISPKIIQLHSEAKNIIKERNELKQSFEIINSNLNKQEELRSIQKRMPEIKNRILSILNSVCKSYKTNQSEESSPLDEFYGRFFVECRRVKELTGQLETCLIGNQTEELLLHLEEVYSLYFDIREQLIMPVFAKNIQNSISKFNRNFCDLFKQTCTSLIWILRNEMQLYYQIFPLLADIGQDQHPIKKQALVGFLKLISKTFYDHLRPVVIHMNHLETLSELYILVMKTMRSEISEESYQSTLSSLAEDIQERMVFRTEVFIQESILDYKPSGGDLAYPEKLECLNGAELRDFQSMWYPTVQRTVLALFYLQRVFDATTFKELAQELASACLMSLNSAYRLVDERHGGSKVEADLFLNKHVAIIKDQLKTYGIEEIDCRPEGRTFALV